MNGRERRKRKGFTVLEILVVVVIIGVLAALTMPKLWSRIGQAKSSVAKQKLASLEQAIDFFRTDCGRYPERLEDLFEPPADVEEKWQPPGIKRKDMIDPWDRQFIYQYPGTYGVYDLYSLGADGAEGGEDDNADIVNW